MKRDTLVAIFSGFIVGLIVAFSFANLPSILKNGLKLSFNLPKITFLRKNIAKPTPTNTPTANFQIISPEGNSLISQNKIDIKGKAPKGSFIIISSNNEDQVVTPTDNNFSTSIALDEGANIIELTAYTNREKFETKKITVSYTPEKL